MKEKQKKNMGVKYDKESVRRVLSEEETLEQWEQ